MWGNTSITQPCVQLQTKEQKSRWKTVCVFVRTTGSSVVIHCYWLRERTSEFVGMRIRSHVNHRTPRVLFYPQKNLCVGSQEKKIHKYPSLWRLTNLTFPRVFSSSCVYYPLCVDFHVIVFVSCPLHQLPRHILSAHPFSPFPYYSIFLNSVLWLILSFSFMFFPTCSLSSTVHVIHTKT